MTGPALPTSSAGTISLRQSKQSVSACRSGTMHNMRLGGCEGRAPDLDIAARVPHRERPFQMSRSGTRQCHHHPATADASVRSERSSRTIGGGGHRRDPVLEFCHERVQCAGRAGLARSSVRPHNRHIFADGRARARYSGSACPTKAKLLSVWTWSKLSNIRSS